MSPVVATPQAPPPPPPAPGAFTQESDDFSDFGSISAVPPPLPLSTVSNDWEVVPPTSTMSFAAPPPVPVLSAPAPAAFVEDDFGLGFASSSNNAVKPSLAAQEDDFGADDFGTTASDGFDSFTPTKDPFGLPSAPAPPLSSSGFDDDWGDSSNGVDNNADFTSSYQPLSEPSGDLFDPVPPAPFEEPPIHSLAPPPPQIDMNDDPYDIHITKPAYVPPPAAAIVAPRNAPVKPNFDDKKPRKSATEDDPFGEFGVLKPKIAAPVKAADPTDTLPLNVLMAAKQQQQLQQQQKEQLEAEAEVRRQQELEQQLQQLKLQQKQSNQPVKMQTPFATSAPVQSGSSNSNIHIAATDDADFAMFGGGSKAGTASTKPADPFATPVDPFASSSLTKSAALSAAPSNVPVDPFASSADPFAPSVPAVSKSTVASTSTTAGLMDDWTVPTVPSKPARQSVVQSAPHSTAISDSDFDVFATKPAATKATSKPVDPFAAPAQVPAQPAQPANPFGSKATEDDTFDVFGIPKPASSSTASTAAQSATAANRIGAVKVPGRGTSAVAGAPTQPPVIASAATRTPATTAKPDIFSPSSDHTRQTAVKKSAFDITASDEEDEDDPLAFSTLAQQRQQSHAQPVRRSVPSAAAAATTAKKAAAPRKTVNLLDGDDNTDDPFAPSNAAEDAFDPLAQLKASYGLQSSHTVEEGDEDDFGFGASSDPFANNSPRDPFCDHSRPVRAPSTRKESFGETSLATSSGITVVMEGEILTRLSTKAMLTKDWHDTYFVILSNTSGSDVLYLFRSRADYFLHVQQQQNLKKARGHAVADASVVYYKKKIVIVHNLRLLQIKAKDYKGLGTCFNFVIEELEDYGPQSLGKFGGTDKEHVQLFWKQMRDIIMRKRQEVRHSCCRISFASSIYSPLTSSLSSFVAQRGSSTVWINRETCILDESWPMIM